MTTDPNEVRKLAGLDKEGESAEDEAISPILPFDVDYTTKQNVSLKGHFVYEVPNIGRQIDIARMKAVYFPQGAIADPNGALLGEMISYLEVTLKEKPPWWKPHEFYDYGVINHVYGRCLEHEAKFLRKDPSNGGRAGGVQKQTQEQETGLTDASGGMDGDIPPPRKRREVLGADNT